MALAQEEIISRQHEVVDNKELTSLLRTVKKDAFLLFIQLKYGAEIKQTATYDELCAFIVSHPEQEEIIRALVEVSDCCKEVDHESFAELCGSYGIKDIIFNEALQTTAVRCYLQTPIELFHRLKVVAAVNKDKQFEVLGGKEITSPIKFEAKHKQQISSVLEGLIEKGRNYIINTEKIKDEIIMTAHFEQRKRTFTTISSGKEISTVTVSPATKAEAKYDTKSNKIQLKCGPNRKIKEYILSTFGQVFFKDNTHFSEQGHRVYQLEKVKSANFSVDLDDELLEELESAVIVEETIRIPYGDDWATLHLKSKDVESLLKELSTEKYDLKSMERTEVTIELRLKAKEDVKSKTVKVTVSDSSKINFNPVYTELVNKCLIKWGIHIGTSRSLIDS